MSLSRGKANVFPKMMKNPLPDEEDEEDEDDN